MDVVELFHQYYDVVRQLPQASTIRVAKKKDLDVFVADEVVKLAFISSQSNYESRNWTRLCCNPAIEVVVNKKVDNVVIDKLKNEVMQEKPTPTSICYQCQLSNLIFTKQAWCDLNLQHSTSAVAACCPCFCCSCVLCCLGDVPAGVGCFFGILGCLGLFFLYENPELVCPKLKMDSLEEAKSLMRTLRMMEREIPNACQPCCCLVKNVDDNFVLFATKFLLLRKIERIMHNMLLDHELTLDDFAEFLLQTEYDSSKLKKMNVDERNEEKARLINTRLRTVHAGTAPNNSETLATYNKEFKLLNIQNRIYRDKISVLLAGELTKMDSEKTFAKNAFRHIFTKRSLEERYLGGHTSLDSIAERILLPNYEALGGKNHSLAPSRLAFVDDLIKKRMVVLNNSCRIKEADSYSKHRDDDDMFDLFGMKYVVSTKGVFDCIAKSFLVASDIRWNEQVYGLATQFKQKGTSFLDFKIIIVLAGEMLSICEVQIVYSGVYVTDSIVDGHSIHKRSTALEEPVIVSPPSSIDADGTANPMTIAYQPGATGQY